MRKGSLHQNRKKAAIESGRENIENRRDLYRKKYLTCS